MYEDDLIKALDGVSPTLPLPPTASLGGGSASGSGRLSSEKRRELALRKIRDVPSLPEVTNEIIRLLGKAATPASEIAKLISYDPGLSSRVLRMVNSAAYGIQRQVSSIQHGIMILGFNNVRGLVLSASLFKIFDGAGSGGLDHKDFWRHSLLVAMLARRTCEYYSLPEKEEAFSAGMLHDIGKLVLDQFFHEDYRSVCVHAEQQGLPSHGMDYLRLEQRLLFGTDHCDIGAQLSTKWKLPPGISEVIEKHHQPEKAIVAKNLTYSVAFANQLAYQILEDELLDWEKLSEPVRDYFSIEAREDLEYVHSELASYQQSVAKLMQAFEESE